MMSVGQLFFERIRDLPGVEYMLEWSDGPSLCLLVVVREIVHEVELDICKVECDVRAMTGRGGLDVMVEPAAGRDVDLDLSGAHGETVYRR